jgi:N-acetylgalactosamine-6-sulfatase
MKNILSHYSIPGVLAFLLFFIVSSCKSTDTSSIIRPNIIFIYADDWGFGDLGCHGSTFLETPNLDKMAGEGTDFRNFLVCNPVCSPSRTAIITGHFPARHSVHGHFASVESHVRRGMPDWLDQNAPMLPRMLKEAGYTTGHFGKWHLSNNHVPDAPSPLEYGYDEYSCFNVSSQFRQMDADSSIYKTIDFIERKRDEAFFVNVWLHATHTPHYPKEKYLKQYEHLEEQQQVYAAVVSEYDDRIGELFGKLKELGLDEKTLVIFSSDNGPEWTGGPGNRLSPDASTGEGLGSYYSVGETGGLKGRKRSLFAGGVRTPFIVRWPGVVPEGRIDSLTEIAGVDMLPTFLDLANVELPVDYLPDGESVLQAFKGKEFKREKEIYWQWKFSRGESDFFWPDAGIQKDNWKLLVNKDLGIVEMYNLSDDWAEKNNLAAEFPGLRDELYKKIEMWESTLPADPPACCMSALREKTASE